MSDQIISVQDPFDDTHTARVSSNIARKAMQAHAEELQSGDPAMAGYHAGWARAIECALEPAEV
jgi:hypothetical protein